MKQEETKKTKETRKTKDTFPKEIKYFCRIHRREESATFIGIMECEEVRIPLYNTESGHTLSYDSVIKYLADDKLSLEKWKTYGLDISKLEDDLLEDADRLGFPKADIETMIETCKDAYKRVGNHLKKEDGSQISQEAFIYGTILSYFHGHVFNELI